MFLITVQGIDTITYCLYAIHPEVFLLNSDRFPGTYHLGVSLSHFPLALLETALVASFFYFAVEKPFDRKKRVIGGSLNG